MPAYISKYNSTHENHIFSMIPNVEKEGWSYLTLQKFSTLLHGITSKTVLGWGNYLNTLQNIRVSSLFKLPFTTKNKFKSHEKMCINKDFCGIVF